MRALTSQATFVATTRLYVARKQYDAAIDDAVGYLLTKTGINRIIAARAELNVAQTAWLEALEIDRLTKAQSNADPYR